MATRCSVRCCSRRQQSHHESSQWPCQHSVSHDACAIAASGECRRLHTCMSMLSCSGVKYPASTSALPGTTTTEKRKARFLCRNVQDAATPLPKSWRAVGGGDAGPGGAAAARSGGAPAPVLAEIGDLWDQVGLPSLASWRLCTHTCHALERALRSVWASACQQCASPGSLPQPSPSNAP